MCSPPTSGVVELDRDAEVFGFCEENEDGTAAVADDVVDIFIVVASVLGVENEGTAALVVKDLIELVGERDPILDGASGEVDG